MIKYAVDINSHFLFCEIIDKVHVAVPDCIHEGVPVVGSVELVDEVREGVEKVYDFFGLARLYFNCWLTDPAEELGNVRSSGYVREIGDLLFYIVSLRKNSVLFVLDHFAKFYIITLA